MIDRHDAAGVERVRLLPLFEKLRFGVLDPHLTAGARDGGTVDGGGAPGLERLREGRVAVVPDDAHGAGPVVRERLHAESSTAHAEGAHRSEADEEGGGLAPDEIRHRGEVASVLVPERQRQEDVRDRGEARRDEALGQGRSHSRNRRDRISKRQRAGRAPRPGGRTAGPPYAPAVSSFNETMPNRSSSPP